MNSDPGIDPINIKNDYFSWINANDSTSSFGKLLQVCQGQSQVAQADIIAKVNGSDDDIKFLARSIVLLWYLGSWYEPEGSEEQANAAKPGRINSSEVLSPKAYTQGLVWQIAGAHPMGYSNLQFGYWSRDPHDPNDHKTPSTHPEDSLREAFMADTCIECDVAIVGSGFAGSLIAKELSQKPIDTQWEATLNVVILEAGPGVQPNINDYMRNFYKASAKVPESPYPPAATERTR